MKKVCIVGSGFSGLGTAYFLASTDQYKITLIEKEGKIGGLASAIKMPEWGWSIEKYVHHWFTNDDCIFDIAKEIGINDKIMIKNTKSSVFYNGRIVQLDSPFSVLRFPFLSFFDRLRMGLAIVAIKIDKNFLRFENETSFSFIKRKMGEDALRIIWAPLFYGKFGKYAPEINAAWFCGRINARTKNLAYTEGGFQTFSEAIAAILKKKGHRILLNTNVKKVIKKEKGFLLKVGNDTESFDYVVLAVPLPIALRLYRFEKELKAKYSLHNSIGAQYFILELKQSFLQDGTYWLNINNKTFPFLLVAEHTNFVDKKHYNNKHMIWVGKYLDYDDPLWTLKEKDLLKKIIPYLKKINSSFDPSWINRSFFFREKNAQSIMRPGYSQEIPPIQTPVENLYLANMNQIYPYDRATNPALEVGKKVALKIIEKENSS